MYLLFVCFLCVNYYLLRFVCLLCVKIEQISGNVVTYTVYEETQGNHETQALSTENHLPQVQEDRRSSFLSVFFFASFFFYCCLSIFLHLMKKFFCRKRLFFIFPRVSSYRWVHFPRYVLFCQPHQQLFTNCSVLIITLSCSGFGCVDVFVGVSVWVLWGWFVCISPERSDSGCSVCNLSTLCLCVCLLYIDYYFQLVGIWVCGCACGCVCVGPMRLVRL